MPRHRSSRSTKLLDGARKEVADLQQDLDNYQQRTRALASAREQDWVATLARVDRAYQVGFLMPRPEAEQDDDAALSVDEFAMLHTPGSARRQLEQLSDEQRTELIGQVVETFGGKVEDYAETGDAYLLGIKNIQAEALAYDKQIRAKADGVAARLQADGEAKVAEVVGNYESQLNQLFDSPGGRAFVAWQAAANVKFAEKLTFQSSDGIPSVLQLRDFARAFMGE